LALPSRSGLFRVARSSLSAAAVLALTLGVLNGAPHISPAQASTDPLQAAGTAEALTRPVVKERTSAKALKRPTVDRPEVRQDRAAKPTARKPAAQPAKPSKASKKTVRPKARTAAEIWADARRRDPAPPEYTVHQPRRVDCTKVKCVALTFDDGPEPGLTDHLLEVLAAEDVRGTFFVVGRKVAADPGPLIRAAWDGHEIGVHTWSHQALTNRSVADVARDLTRTMNQVTRVSGVRPWLVRPPFGAINDATVRNVPYPLVLWSVDPYDWRDRNRELITQRVTANGRPGSVVLLHDVHSESVAAVPAIIDFYRRHGYAFVTVSELYGHKLRAHRVYRGREAASVRAKAVKPDPAPAQPTPTPTPTPTPSPVAKSDEAEVVEDPTTEPTREPTPTPEPTGTPSPAATAPPEP
jgi:peptidoglycan/xylan/chitin deacetylase (PgdA/CDA1 family)